MYVLLVTFLFLSPIVGIALLWRGLRGRRMDDHPHCRKCGFDLFGSPHADSCPECGAGLTGARAVRQARRRQRPGAILSGVVLLVLFLAQGGAKLWSHYHDFNWQHAKPEWWLTMELSAAGGVTSDAAIFELIRRLVKDELSPAGIDRVASYALKIQADPKARWNSDWGNFVEAAWYKHRLDEASLNRYLEQAVQLQLEVRPRVRLGDPLPYRLTKTIRASAGEMRPDSSGRIVPFELSITLRDGRSSDALLPMQFRDVMALENRFGDPAESIELVHAIRQTNLPLGTHTFALEMDLTVSNTDLYASMRNWTRSLQATVQVLPATAQTVHVVSAESLRPAVEAAITTTHVVLDTLKWPREASIEVHVQTPPVGVGYEVLLRQGGRLWPMQKGACAQGREETWQMRRNIDTHFQATRVDVVLRPSVPAAYESVDVFEVWDHSIMIENVPVYHDD